jgi:hypothetical protein
VLHKRHFFIFKQNIYIEKKHMYKVSRSLKASDIMSHQKILLRFSPQACQKMNIHCPFTNEKMKHGEGMSQPNATQQMKPFYVMNT